MPNSLTESISLILSLDKDLIDITLLTLRITLSSLTLSIIIGLPIGTLLGLSGHIPARGFIMAFLYTGMGLPPVVVGLVVFILLSRSGPMGHLEWLFSPNAMIFAQTIIALPIIVGLTMASTGSTHPLLPQQITSLGATKLQTAITILSESKYGLLAAIAATYGRIVAEVGAVLLVGGNIETKTRVLTTAIVLETRKGAFGFALGLGLILLTITFVANIILLRFGNWNNDQQ